MASILRLHEDGDNTIQDWNISQAYDKTLINKINNPNGESDKREITSIPSPFARLDLFRIAFEFLADPLNDIDGKSIYHKLISESLDVAEIFFYIDKLKNKVEIVEWRRSQDLQDLLQSKNKGHKRLGATYDLFLKQDEKSFNFQNLDSIFILKYIGPDRKSEMDIIGATSPLSLFFTPANDLSYVSKHLPFGDDYPFDSDYCPLYKRDLEFQAYYRSIANEFNLPAVETYLSKNYRRLSDSQKEDVDELANSDQRVELKLPNGSLVKIGNIALQQHVVDMDSISKSSDFVIDSSKAGSRPPLVLPVEAFSSRLKYVNSLWDNSTRVPYFDNTIIENRLLPNEGTNYPYLSIGDFLANNIIEVPKTLNSKEYFNGNIEMVTTTNISYLLPITETLLKYFSIQDLTTKTYTRGEKMISMREKPTGIEVVLRIPIVNKSKVDNIEYISFTRIYSTNTATANIKKMPLDTDKQIGGTRSLDFTLSIFPFLKFPKIENINKDYRVSLISYDPGNKPFNNNKDYSLTFFKENGIKEHENLIQKNKRDNNTKYDNSIVDVSTYIVSDNFDAVGVKIDDTVGFVIPKFKDKSGSSKFLFSVDFGTTNTHIEYKNDHMGVSKAYVITEDDMQLSTLHNLDRTNATHFQFFKVIEQDITPFLIQDKEDKKANLSFPIRTCLSEYKYISHNRVSNAETNMQFFYEKLPALDYNNSITDLKWSGDNNALPRIKSYFENIILLLRNKVLLNEGDLKSTKLTWFYPSSMTKYQREKMNKTWRYMYKKYINSSEDYEHLLNEMPESLAPYYYYTSNTAAGKNTVCVDVGGGTADILIPSDNSYITNSIRFGADSLFGDGYSSNQTQNGYINKYVKMFEEQLSQLNKNYREKNTELANQLNYLSTNLVSFKNSGACSSDIISLLFSISNFIKDQCKVEDASLNFLLSENSNIKYCFLLYYTAIMYHIAILSKRNNLPMPRHITFSGNGSNIIRIISSDIDGSLKEFTKIIFENIYQEKYNFNGLTIIQSDYPKEATCKGGIDALQNPRGDNFTISEISMIDFKGKKDISEIKISDALSIKDKVVDDVKKFYNFFFKLNEQFSFKDNFDINLAVMEKVQRICYTDIETFYEKGLESRRRQQADFSDADASINDCLMFIPLIETLNTLAQELLN